METITVREYSAFCEGEKNGEYINGYYTLKRSTFRSLETFVLENSKDRADSVLEIMGISARRGVGKIITVKNYVGVIAMKDGTAIEILPKICSSQKADSSRVKLLVMDMLRVLKDPSHKKKQITKVDVGRVSLLDVFIRTFLDETLSIVKQGLRSGYGTVEDNLTSVKGKICFSEQIRRNLIHKERMCVAYDVFHADRPENKLLKSTLMYLSSKTHSLKNKKDIKELLRVFADISPSVNHDADFSKVVLDKNTVSYTMALRLAQVFLQGKSFTSFSGSSVSLAVLFPMERLFEAYMAAVLKRAFASVGASVSVQDARYHLFDSPEKFSLRPDLVITKKNGDVFIVDTKWKLLYDDPRANYGISQSDMYQMYAYHKKYEDHGLRVKGVLLLYPATDVPIAPPPFTDQSGVAVAVHFVDMLALEESVRNFLLIIG